MRQYKLYTPLMFITIFLSYIGIFVSPYIINIITSGFYNKIGEDIIYILVLFKLELIYICFESLIQLLFILLMGYLTKKYINIYGVIICIIIDYIFPFNNLFGLIGFFLTIMVCYLLMIQCKYFVYKEDQKTNNDH